MFAAVDLDGAETGMAGLAGDRRAVSAFARALGDEPGAERVPAEFASTAGS